MRRASRWALAAFALYLAVGVVWAVTNLGAVPRYGDTGDYTKRASTFEVDGYRRILYPALLWTAGRLVGELSLEAPARAFTTVQVFQHTVSVACIAYFLLVMLSRHALASATPRRTRRMTLGALLGLIALDPLVSHFNLSIMTDGLALSASLAFCTALAQLATARSAPAGAWCVLVLSSLVMANLRPEKGWIMVGTCVSSHLVWRSLARRGGIVADRALGRRGLLASGLVASLCILAQLGHGLLTQGHERWPVPETFTHHRLIYPHLEAVYDHLPEHLRSRISREDARLYDRRPHDTWLVIDRVTNRDPDDRALVTSELLGVVLRHRWPQIVGRIVQAFAENLLATPSFYVRLIAWKISGEGARAYQHYIEGTPWTYHNLARHHPTLSALFVAASATLFAVACCIAIVRLTSRPRGSTSRPVGSAFGVALVPFGAFAFFNALLFALSSGIIYIRYTVFSHVLIVFLVYLVALRWVLGERDEPGAPIASASDR